MLSLLVPYSVDKAIKTINWFCDSWNWARTVQAETLVRSLSSTYRITLHRYSKITFIHTWAKWWRHQMKTFYALLAIGEGNPRSPADSPHKGQWRGALMLSLICAWTNGWANDQDAGDMRRHRAHYDVTVTKMTATPQIMTLITDRISLVQIIAWRCIRRTVAQHCLW